MTNPSDATALQSHLSDTLALVHGPDQMVTSNARDAALALSQQANEIGMTGYTGAAERVAFVAGNGLLKTPENAVAAVTKEGPVGLAITAAESVALGAGMRMLMGKAAPVAGLATLALGTSFLAKTAPQFIDACAKGLNARTWDDMDQASNKFAVATGTLAVDSLIGAAGFKLGSGGIGLTRFAKDAPAVGESTASGDAKGADATAESARVTDATKIVKSVVSPEHTLSMRELAEKDPAKFEKVLNEYYPKLENAFPDASEIESKDTYRDYLHDKDFPWDMLVLNDNKGNVLGGIQSQVVDVGGSEINKAVWAEHIWLAPEARTYTNFQTLLKTSVERWKDTGSDVVFMEFNDRAKMTLAQQNDDAAAGLTPEAREKIWGRVGLYVLGDETGRIAPYAQPAMGDGEPVTYLSVGMAPLKGKTLDGQSVPVDDYLKLLKAAHSTIPSVTDADPTVVDYTTALNDIKATGQDRLSFAKLKDTEVLRLINQRFIAKPAAAANSESQPGG